MRFDQDQSGDLDKREVQQALTAAGAMTLTPSSHLPC